MKPSSPLPTLCALFMSASLLSSCSAASAPDPSPSVTSPHESASSEDPRTAYESELAELREALLALKEENYIQKAEYEARIATLLALLAAQEPTTEPAEGTAPTPDLPVSGAPLPPSAGTEEPAPSMAFQYEMRDGRAVILSYLGDEPHVTVPAAIEGYPVTVIADDAFRGTDIIAVRIPYSVTEIGWFAFADCQSLTAVTLPPSVESIGYGAFDGCNALTLICPADSYAAAYAASFGIPHTEK